jgi:hypothetical protein
MAVDAGPSVGGMGELTHVYPMGRGRMVDVSPKEPRIAGRHGARCDVALGLLFSALGTAVLAGFSMLWKANFVVDALLLGYVCLLVPARRPTVKSSPLQHCSFADTCGLLG